MRSASKEYGEDSKFLFSKYIVISLVKKLHMWNFRDLFCGVRLIVTCGDLNLTCSFPVVAS